MVAVARTAEHIRTQKQERQYLRDIFGLFYKQHYLRLFRYCNDRVEDPVVAEDIVQESFARFFKVFLERNGVIARKDKPGDRAVSYLYEIAKNLLYNRARRPKDRPHVSLDALVEEQGDRSVPAVDASELSDMPSLKQALQELTPLRRQVVVLRIILGHSTAETAAITRKSETAVKTILHRARAMLREILTEEYRPG